MESKNGHKLLGEMVAMFMEGVCYVDQEGTVLFRPSVHVMHHTPL